MSSFNKDSTSELLILQRYSMAQQFNLLIANGRLSNSDKNLATQLLGYVNSFGEANYKAIIEDPANAYFKQATLYFLPNYNGFGGYARLALIEKPTYVINGPVQLSLTFNNSSYLPQLKQARQLDYDFRVFGYAKDSVNLNGYYNSNSNKVCKLLAVRNEQGVVDYNNGAGMFNFCVFTRVNVSLKMDGVKVEVPPSYFYGLRFFLSKFRDGVMNKKLMEFSYELMDPTAADLPEAFKDVRFCTVAGSYADGYNAAPVGTALITMNAYTAAGTKKVLEFIKE